MQTLTITSTDADEIEELNRSAGYDVRYVRLRSGAFRGRYTQVELGEIIVIEEEFDGALHIFGEPPPGFVAIGLPTVLSSDTRWLRSDVTRHELVTLPGSTELDILSGSYLRSYSILIPIARLLRIAQTLDLPSLADGLPRNGRTLNADLAQDLHSSLARVLRAPPDRIEAAELESALLSTLCTELAGRGDRSEDHAPRANERVKCARTARDYIESNLTGQVRVEDIAFVCRTSVRSLQRCFHEVYGVTPTAYTRSRKLDEARRLLRCAEPPRNVASAAMSNGISQLGRFAGEYRTVYGETPRETLAASRKAAE